MLTTDVHNLINVYDKIKPRGSRIILERRRKGTKSNKDHRSQFDINKVNIFVKRGNDNPMILYRGKVTDFEKRDNITLIDAVDRDKKLIIKIDKNDTVDITVLDSNNNIEDEFIVHGMQLRDIDEPDKLSIIKVEEVG